MKGGEHRRLRVSGHLDCVAPGRAFPTRKETGPRIWVPSERLLVSSEGHAVSREVKSGQSCCVPSERLQTPPQRSPSLGPPPTPQASSRLCTDVQRFPRAGSSEKIVQRLYCLKKSLLFIKKRKCTVPKMALGKLSVQHPFRIKTLRRVGTEGTHPNTTEPTAAITLPPGDRELSPQIGNEAAGPLSPVLHTVLRVLARAGRQEKEIGIQPGREDVELSLLADGMKSYLKTPTTP